MTMIEKIMKWWAKIASLTIIFGIFYFIYLGFSLVGFYTAEVVTLGNTIVSVLGIMFGIVFGLSFYSPFFYYGWVKNSDSENWKSFTKIVTVVYAVAVTISSILSGVGFATNIIVIPIALLIIAPLYYFGWRR